MKKIFSLIIITALFTSCKKDSPQAIAPAPSGNKPPVANAGADQITTLPKDSVALDGSSSSDPDGTITTYSWTKIAGPSSPNISSTHYLPIKTPASKPGWIKPHLLFLLLCKLYC